MIAGRQAAKEGGGALMSRVGDQLLHFQHSSFAGMCATRIPSGAT